MRGWVIKFNDGDYKGNKNSYASDDLRCAYIYRSKEMAERVVSKFAVETEIVEVEIHEV